MRSISNTLILLIILAGTIWLQIFLSKKANKWYGLILPLFPFLFSLLKVLNIMDTGSLWQNITLIVISFLILNIPTIILLVIYFVCREKLKKQAQIDKMNIQDL